MADSSPASRRRTRFILRNGFRCAAMAGETKLCCQHMMVNNGSRSPQNVKARVPNDVYGAAFADQTCVDRLLMGGHTLNRTSSGIVMRQL